MANQSDNTVYTNPMNQGGVNPMNSYQQTLMDADKKAKVTAYILGGASAGVVAGAAAAFIHSKIGDEQSHFDEQIDGLVQATEEQVVEAQEAMADAEPQYVVHETRVINVTPPASPTPPAQGHHIPNPEGTYITMGDGSVAYAEVHVINGMQVMAVDMNLDNTWDVYVLPELSDSGELVWLPGPGYESLEYGDEGLVMAAQPDASFQNIGSWEEVSTNFYLANNEMPPFIEDDLSSGYTPDENPLAQNEGGEVPDGEENPGGGTDDGVVIIDGNPNAQDGLGQGLVAENENVEPIVQDEPSYEEPGGDIGIDVTTEPEPEVYIAETSSSDGMDDFVNDANVDMLA